MFGCKRIDFFVGGFNAIQTRLQHFACAETALGNTLRDFRAREVMQTHGAIGLGQ